MASRSVNHSVSRIDQRTGRNTPGNARNVGSRKDVFDSQKGKEGVSMDKNKGQQQRKASTSRIKKNSALTDTSNSIRQSPRKKQFIPLNKPVQSGSAKPNLSQKVERKTTAAAFAGNRARVNPGGAEYIADYQTDNESTATQPSTRESVTKQKNITFTESPRNVLKRRQSPRKKQITVESVNTDSVRYASPKVGRRTGEAAFAGKHIRIMADGFENFDDYWTDDESAATEPSTRESVTKQRNITFTESPRNVPKRRQSPRKKQVIDVESVNTDQVRYAFPKVGRRTGEAAFTGKRIKINPDGFENFEDYWTDDESAATEPSTRESVTKQRNVTFTESPRYVPKRRQSPRKKQVRDVESVNTDPVRDVESVNTDPVRYASPKVGRRTGEAAFAGKRIRINPDGFENFEDYWTDNESTATEPSSRESVTKAKRVSFSELPVNVPEKRQSPRKKQVTDLEESVKNDTRAYALPRVGRQTAEAAFSGKHIRLKPDRTEDFWTDEASNSNESSLTKSKVTLNESSSSNNDEPEKVMLDKSCNTFRNVGVNDKSLIYIRNKKDSFQHRTSTNRALFPNELSLSSQGSDETNNTDQTIGKHSLNENIFKDNEKLTESERKKLKKQKYSISTYTSKRSQLFEDLEVADKSANTEDSRVALIGSRNETTDKSLQMSSSNSRSSRIKSKLIEESSGDSSNELDNIRAKKIPSTRDEGGTSMYSPSKKTKKLNSSKRKSQVGENDAEESAKEIGHANELTFEEDASISLESKKTKQRSAKKKSRLIDDDSVVSGKEFDNIRVDKIPSTSDEEGDPSYSPSRKTKLNTSKSKRKSSVAQNNNEKSAQENTPKGKDSTKKKQTRSARNSSWFIGDYSDVSVREFDDIRVNEIPSARDEEASLHSTSKKTNELNKSKLKRKSQVLENDAEKSVQENAPTVKEPMKKKQKSARNKSRLIDDDSEISGKEFDNIPSTRDKGGASTHSSLRKINKSNTSKSIRKSQVVEYDTEESACENEPMGKESKKQRSARNNSTTINDNSEVSGKEFDDIPSIRDEGGASTHSPSRKMDKSIRKSRVVEYDSEESAGITELGANELSTEKNALIDKESKKKKSSRNNSRSINDNSEVSDKEFDDIPSTRHEGGASTHSPSRKMNKSIRKSRIVEYDSEESARNELSFEEIAQMDKVSKKKQSSRNNSKSINNYSEVSGKEFKDISIRDERGASTHSPSRKINKSNTSKSKQKSRVVEYDTDGSAGISELGANELSTEKNVLIDKESKKKKSSRNNSRSINDNSEVSDKEFDDIPSTRHEGGASTHSPSRKMNKSIRKSRIVDYDSEESARNELSFEEIAQMDKVSKKKQSSRNNSKSINNYSEVSGKEFKDISIRDERGASTHSPLRKINKSNASKSRQKSRVVEYDTDESAGISELGANELSTEKNALIDKESKNKKSSRNNSRSINNDSDVSGKEFEDIPSTRHEGGASPSRKTNKLNTTTSKRKSQVVENETGDSEENELEANKSPSTENAPSGKKSKKKKRIEIPPEQLRRSKRERTHCLAHWRGERRTLRIVNGEIIVTGIDPGRREDNSSAAAIASLKQYIKNNKVKKTEKSKLKHLPKTTVLAPQTHEYVEVNLHRPFNFVEWSAVRVDDDQKVPYYLTKTFSSERVTFGFLDMCPLQTKASQYSPDDNIHFVVQKGQVKVVIRKTDFEFGKNDSFIVPCTEAYSIQNLGKSNALLSFCTFKIPFFSYQSAQSKK